MSPPGENLYKITSEVRSKLQYLPGDLIESFGCKWVRTQRIKMLQIALQYTLPRLKQATNEVSEDLPLFID